MLTDDERIALFLDYENLAIGARDGLGVAPFDFGPIADALAERGRVVTRRAYADWSYFDEDRRLLARAQVELIEIPQRLGGSRKNAADIKMAVDAIELAYERDFITTFAIGTGDSDFTPLVHKLRELDKRVIGIGVQSSTSALLPPACDEFLFYDRLPGVDAARRRAAPRAARARGRPRRRLPQPAPSRRPAPRRHRPDDLGPLVAPHPGRPAAARRRPGAGLPAQAGDPAQGPDLRRGRPRLPRLRRAAAPPGGPAGGRAAAGQRAGRPRGGLPGGRLGRGRGVPAAGRRGRAAAGGGARPQLSGLKNQLRKREPDVQREALRLQQLPVLRPRPRGPAA